MVFQQLVQFSIFTNNETGKIDVKILRASDKVPDDLYHLAHDFLKPQVKDIVDSFGDQTLDLIWSISDGYDWLNYYPTEGICTDEIDTVTIEINTSGLSLGQYSGILDINSNGGNGEFIISFNIAELENSNNPISPTKYNHLILLIALLVIIFIPFGS